MEYLDKHPLLGAGASLFSVAVSFLDTMTPYLEFATLCVGFMIGAVTLYGKIKKVKNDGNKDS